MFLILCKKKEKRWTFYKDLYRLVKGLFTKKRFESNLRLRQESIVVTADISVAPFQQRQLDPSSP